MRVFYFDKCFIFTIFILLSNMKNKSEEVEVKDSFGVEINVGDRITWSEHSIERSGIVVLDIRYRASMRIGGRSIPNIIEESEWVRVVS